MTQPEASVNTHICVINLTCSASYTAEVRVTGAHTAGISYGMITLSINRCENKVIRGAEWVCRCKDLRINQHDEKDKS